MKNKILLVVLFVFVFGNCSYGISLKDSLDCNYPNRFVVGSQLRWSHVNFVDGNDNKNLFTYRFEPELSLYSKINLGIGLHGVFEHGVSDYGAKIPKLYGLGAFLRYYYPLKLKRFGKDRFKLYCELGYLRTNYYMNNTKEIVPNSSDKLSGNILSIPVGASIRIWRGLYGKFEIRPDFYLNGNSMINYFQIGFEYQI